MTTKRFTSRKPVFYSTPRREELNIQLRVINSEIEGLEETKSNAHGDEGRSTRRSIRKELAHLSEQRDEIIKLINAEPKPAASATHTVNSILNDLDANITAYAAYQEKFIASLRDNAAYALHNADDLVFYQIRADYSRLIFTIIERHMDDGLGFLPLKLLVEIIDSVRKSYTEDILRASRHPLQERFYEQLVTAAKAKILDDYDFSYSEAKHHFEKGTADDHYEFDESDSEPADETAE